MGRFRKKPVQVEAMEWTGENFDEASKFCVGIKLTRLNGTHPTKGYLDDGYLMVSTLEDGPQGQAIHVADPGDWIIKGVKGEFYPCKPDIFAATYDPVEER